MTYRTLGELRSIVLARIGMSAMGASGGAAGTLIDSFLSNGQTQLYNLQDWQHLIDYLDVSTGVGQTLYDYPAAGTMNTALGCARDRRVLRIESVYSGQYSRMTEGIETSDYSNIGTQGSPQKYEKLAQILVYPEADAVYTMRIWFVADLGRFTQDNDRASLDDEMVLLHATTNAKAHYRQPDAKLYEGQLNTLLGGLRGKSFRGVYRRGDQGNAERKPAVLGR